MGFYEYKALNSAGAEIKGKMEATNADQVSRNLQKKQLYPLTIAVVAGQSSLSRLDLLKKLKLFQKKVSNKTLAGFSRQLGILFSVGIAYNRALEIYINDCPDAYFQNILSDVKAKILDGASLTKAIQGYPEVFPRYYLSTVQAGEKTGTLGQNLIRQADFLDSQNDLNSKVQTALIYPSIMAVLGISIIIFMIEFIIPKITPIFDQFKRSLPWPTRVVVFLSNVLSSYPYLLLFLLLGILVSLQVFFNRPSGRQKLDAWLLKIPVLKKLILKIILLKFTQSLEVLLRSGVDLREALTIAGSSTSNSVFENRILAVREATTVKGLSLSQAMRQNELVDESYIQILKVGEESGRLEEMVGRVAEQMQKETSATIQKYLAFLEPVIILTMALFVGFIVLAVMLPIFEMNQVLQ